MDWRDSFFQHEEAVQMKKELEAFISRGNSVEEAFSTLQRQRAEHLTEDDFAAATHVYLPLAVLQLQYGALQEDVQETVLTLLSQGGASDYPQAAVSALKQELKKEAF